MISKRMKKSVIEPLKDKKKIFRVNRFLSNWYVLPIFTLLIDVVFILCLNYLFNSLGNLRLYFIDKENAALYFSWKNMFHLIERKGIYKVCIPVLSVLDILFIFKVKEAFSDDYFNVNQKGNAEWTSLEEIKEQYLEIDEKDTPYPGWSGCIISRYGDKLYIDQSDVNNIYIGMTRVGKGEMFAIPSIEVYSRAEKKKSLIVLDMKCSHYKMTKPMLESRGYDVYFMNLPDPEHSMMYNMLTDVIRLWKSGDELNAELLAKASSVMLFCGKESENGDMKYFADTASDMCCAMILASLEDCLEEDIKENKKRKEVYERKIAAFKSLPEEEKNKAVEIYKEKQNEVEDIIMDSEILAIPDTEEFFVTNFNERCINFYSMINIFTELSTIQVPESQLTGVDLYFNNRPEFNRAKLRYLGTKVTGDRTKGSVFSEMLRKLGEFTYESVAKMTAESSLDIRDIGFGDKPVAVFLGVPSHDKSKYFIPTLFLQQVYYVLAQECVEYGKCKRKVKVIGDEIGNFPRIDRFETQLSFGAGLGITYDLYIQDEQQMKEVYGENYKTIINNCSNKVWLLSNDPDTAKSFSEMLGTKSITDIQRVGSKYSLHKTYHENIAEEPLMRSEDLMNLKQGECIVYRATTRTDLEGHDITAKPIFNSIENGQRFKYRYQYLPEIKNEDEVRLSEINPWDCSYINPRKRVWDYKKTFDKLKDQQYKEESHKLGDMSEKKYKAFNTALKKAFGDDILKRWELNSETKIEEIILKIKDTDEIKNEKKRPLLSVLEGELKVHDSNADNTADGYFDCFF